MREHSWAWMAGRLLAIILLGLWGASFFGGGSGEKEFQKTLDALKQVHSFRASYSGTPSGYQHLDQLWEIDCERGIVHQQQHIRSTPAAPEPVDTKQDEFYVGGKQYGRMSDGAWSQMQASWQGNAAKWYCANLGQGTDSNVLPPIATMLQRGILQKGDKKTVNGVRCREWLVTIKGPLANLEHDKVCIGIEDHLPYEMTVDWQGSHSSFSDYNTPMQFDLPEGAMQPVQPASAQAGSN